MFENTHTLATFGTCTEAQKDSQLKNAEFFVHVVNSTMYAPKTNIQSVNSYALYHKVSEPARLPSTNDSLHSHLLQCWYQVQEWRQANVSLPELPDPLDSGRKVDDNGHIVPVLMTNEAMPRDCIELLTCGCKTGCTRRCTPKRNRISCTGACKCTHQCMNPFNLHTDSDVDD